MRAQLIVTVLAVGLAAPAWGGDRAVPRGGGSHSSSSSAVDRHPSSSTGSSHSSPSWSGSSRSSAVPRTEAQARHPRPGTGRGSRGGYYGHRHYYPRYYGGYYGWPYYYGYYGWPYWGFGLGWYDYSTPPYYRYRDYDAYGALRIMADPDKTRVYVDGYYAGVSDDFDGMFQRLNVAPGRHEITLKLEGYVTHRVKVYAPPDTTVKIKHNMVKGNGPDTVEDRISDDDEQAMREEEPRYDPDRDRERRQDQYERERRSSPEPEDEDVPPPATLRLRVAPEDASIYIDGRFRGTGRQLDELLLPPGRHKLEVVRPGYRTHESEFEASEDKPTELEVSLDKL